MGEVRRGIWRTLWRTDWRAQWSSTWRGILRLMTPLLALLMAWPGARAEIDPATAERLLRVSGMWVQLDGMAAQLRQGLGEAGAQAGRPLAPEDAARLDAALSAAYAGERLRSVAMRQLTQDLDPGHLPALFAWYASPSGALMTRLEEQAMGDSRAPDAVAAEGSALRETMDARRRGLIDAVVQASGSVDLALSVTLNTVAGVRQGLAGVMPPGEGPTPEATRALLAEQLPGLRAAYERWLRAGSAVVYASASDLQLAEYVAFLRSPAGQHLGDMLLRALDAACLEGATELGRRLAPAAGRPA